MIKKQKIKDAVEFRDVLERAAEEDLKDRFDIPYKVRSAIGKTLRRIRAEMKEYDNEKSRLIELYGVKTVTGGYSVSPEIDNKPNPKYQQFAEEMRKMGEDEVEYEVVTFNEADIATSKKFPIQISVDMFEAGMITEETPKVKNQPKTTEEE